MQNESEKYCTVFFKALFRVIAEVVMFLGPLFCGNAGSENLICHQTVIVHTIKRHYVLNDYSNHSLRI